MVLLRGGSWRETCFAPFAVRNGTKAGRGKVLLVLGGGMPESEALLADLQARGEFQLLRAATGDRAESMLLDAPVSLVLACAEASIPEIERLVAAVRRTGRATPVLAIRNVRSGEAERCAQLGVGVLRSPLLPDALVRSVEVVLGLKSHG